MRFKKIERNYDYYEGKFQSQPHVNDDLGAMDAFEHLEELKKNPPISKMGKKKLNYYKQKLKDYG